MTIMFFFHYRNGGIREKILELFREARISKDVYWSASPHAICPARAAAYSAGYDLYSATHFEIPPYSRALIPTGISLRMISGIYGWTTPRSGLAFKRHIDVAGGVIDPDYIGEVKVNLVSNNSDDFIVHEGDRIAQIVFEKYLNVALQPLQAGCGERNIKGFDSSGK